MLELDGKLKGTLEIPSNLSFSMALYSSLVDEGTCNRTLVFEARKLPV